MIVGDDSTDSLTVVYPADGIVIAVYPHRAFVVMNYQGGAWANHTCVSMRIKLRPGIVGAGLAFNGTNANRLKRGNCS